MFLPEMLDFKVSQNSIRRHGLDFWVQTIVPNRLEERIWVWDILVNYTLWYHWFTALVLFAEGKGLLRPWGSIRFSSSSKRPTTSFPSSCGSPLYTTFSASSLSSRGLSWYHPNRVVYLVCYSVGIQRGSYCWEMRKSCCYLRGKERKN